MSNDDENDGGGCLSNYPGALIAGGGKAVRLLLAIAIAVTPAIAIVLARLLVEEVAIPVTLDAGSTTYPAAVERLESTSQILVTIALSILAATAYLIVNLKLRHPQWCYGFAYVIFIADVVSVYFAIRLGYSAAITVTSGVGDIVIMGELLNHQAIFVLMSASSLLALFVVTGDADAKKSE